MIIHCIKPRIRFFYIVILFANYFFILACTQSVHENNKPIPKCEYIKSSSIDSLIKQGINDIGNLSGDTIKCISLVKLYNTLHVNKSYQTIKSTVKDTFINHFERKYMNIAFNILSCTYGHGMRIYSKKYDLFIGLGEYERCKDVYTLIDSPEN